MPNLEARSTMATIVAIEVIIGAKATVVNRFSALMTAENIKRIPEINTIGNSKRNMRWIDVCTSGVYLLEISVIRIGPVA